MSKPRCAFLAAAALAAAALLPATVASAAAAVGEIVRDGNLFSLTTPHYIIETDISPEAARLVGEHMEIVGAAYCRILQGLGPVRVPRFRVRIYRRRFDYVEIVGVNNLNTIGLYVPRLQMLLACVDSDDLDAILGVLRHEGWHQFIHHLIEPIPPWVDEGMAEYFRFSRVAGRTLKGGGVPVRHLRFVQSQIKRGTAMPLANIMNLTLAQWNGIREDSPLQGDLEYRESWLLVHFLVEADGGRYVNYLNQYVMLLRRGEAPERALRAVFGANLAPLQEAWAKYVMALKPTPRFVCRDNLSRLGEILLYRSRGRRFANAEELRGALLKGELGRWVLGEDEGRPLRSDDLDAIGALFHCPDDKRPADALSYELRYVKPDDKLPEIICRHHGDFTIRMWYTHDARTQEWQQHVAEAPVDEKAQAAPRAAP